MTIISPVVGDVVGAVVGDVVGVGGGNPFPEMSDVAVDPSLSYIEDGVAGTAVVSYNGFLILPPDMNLDAFIIKIDGVKAHITGVDEDFGAGGKGILVEFTPPVRYGQVVTFQYDSRIDPRFTEDGNGDKPINNVISTLDNRVQESALHVEFLSDTGDSGFNITGTGFVDFGDGTMIPFTSGVAVTGQCVAGVKGSIYSSDATKFRLLGTKIVSIDVLNGEKIIDVHGMFSASKDHIVHLRMFGLKKLIDMSNVAIGLGSLETFEGGDFPLVTTIKSAFSGCHALKEFAIGALPKVLDASNAWSGAGDGTLDMPALSLPEATTVASIFSSSKVNSLGNLDAPKALSIASGFNSAHVLAIGNLNLPACVSFADAFHNSHVVTIGQIITPASGASFSHMFHNAHQLTCIGAISTLGNTSFSSMFIGATKLVNPSHSEQNLIASSAGFAYVNNNDCGDYHPVTLATFTTDGGAFGFEADDAGSVDWGDGTLVPFSAGVVHGHPAEDAPCSIHLFGTVVTHLKFDTTEVGKLKTLHIVDGSQLTSLERLVTAQTKLETLELTGLTDKLVSTSYAFNACRLLTSIPLFDTSNVTDFTAMFHGCKLLASIEPYDFSSGLTGHQLFSNCMAVKSFSNLDLRKFTRLTEMFAFCFEAVSIDMQTSPANKDFGSMFSGALSLICINAIDTSGQTNTVNMFNDAPLLQHPTKAEQFDIASGSSWTNADACPNPNAPISPKLVSSVVTDGRHLVATYDQDIEEDCVSQVSLAVKIVGHVTQDHPTAHTIVGKVLTLTMRHGVTASDELVWEYWHTDVHPCAITSASTPKLSIPVTRIAWGGGFPVDNQVSDPPVPVDLVALADYLVGDGWNATPQLVMPFGINIENPTGTTTFYPEDMLLSCDLSTITPAPLHNDFCDGLKDQGLCLDGNCP